MQAVSTSATPGSTGAGPACQARTAERHPFPVNAVFAALARTRLALRRAAACALARFAMVNVKLPSFLEPVWNRLWAWAGLRRPCRNTRRPCRPCSEPA